MTQKRRVSRFSRSMASCWAFSCASRSRLAMMAG
nr:MAG TPA: hypothetical protein [Caudoviricetes sp.]